MPGRVRELQYTKGAGASRSRSHRNGAGWRDTELQISKPGKWNSGATAHRNCALLSARRWRRWGDVPAAPSPACCPWGLHTHHRLAFAKQHPLAWPNTFTVCWGKPGRVVSKVEHVPTKAMGMIWGRGVGGRSSWCKSGKQGLSCPVLPGEFGELFTLQTSLFLTFPFLLQTHPDLPSFSDTGAHNLGPHFAMATLWHANSWPLGNIFNQLKK